MAEWPTGRGAQRAPVLLPHMAAFVLMFTLRYGIAYRIERSTQRLEYSLNLHDLLPDPIDQAKKGECRLALRVFRMTTSNPGDRR